MGFPRRAAPALFAAAVALAAAVAVAADGHHEPLPVEESSVNHASISLDVGEIEAALGEVPPNYALAIDIYTNGKNSPKGTGLRTLKGMAAKDLSAEPLVAGFVTLYGATDFLDQFTTAALEGTGDFAGKSDVARTVAAKKNLQATLVLYANHEAEEAIEQAEAGVALNAEKAPGSNNIYYDEYWAFWYGLTGIDAPHEVTVKRDADFGTMSAKAAYAAFAEGRDAALDADAAGIRAAQADINAAILTTFLQATLKYSYKVQAGGNDKDWAEGYTYWRVMAGAVAAADLETAKAIDALWDMSAASIDTLASDVHCQIMHLLDDALPIMGISYSALGELTQDHGKGIVIPEGICPLPVEQSSVNHASIALDVGEIEAALGEDPPNYALAIDIYTNGKNSPKGTGMRTLKGMAAKDLSAEPLVAGFVALYGATDFLDQFTTAALEGTGDFAGKSDVARTVAAKKNLQATLVLYANHEAEEAIEQAEAGVALNAEKAPGSNNIYYDEYWAFWYGLTGIDAPHEVTVKRDADFGTMSANAAYAAFAEGRDAALAADAAGIRAAQANINAAILTTFLQATLKYSYKVQAGGNDKDWAEGYTYWRVMAGAVAAADLETAKAIDALWDMSAASIDTLASDVHCQIMHLLYDALPIMDISYSALGELTQDHGKGIVIPEGICPLPVEQSSVNHASIALDVGEIEAALGEDPPNYALAIDIYTNGKNSPKGTGMRTLKGMAAKDLSAEPLVAGFVALYGATDFLDQFTTAALEGTGDFAGKSDVARTVAAKKNLQATLVLYANHEAEEAIEQAEAGVALNAEKAPGSNNIYYDEYWAFWYGLTGIDAPHEVTVKRDADFGTMSANAAYAAFAEGRDAALDADAAGIRAAQADINAAILTTFLQATLKYSYKVQAGGNDKDWAEGYTYWRVMAGAVAAADLETAKAIDALWDMSAASIDTLASDVHCQIMHLLDDALPIMGISYSALGELTQDHGKGIVIPMGICPLPVEQSSVNHASIALDVGEIEAALGEDPPNYALAIDIYTNGKNSPKGTGKRTLKGMAAKDLSAEPLVAGFVALYGATDFLDQFTTAALEGTGDFAGKSDVARTVAAKKNLQATLVLYANHEAEEAIEQAEAGVALNAEKAPGSNNIYYDEYWAFWYGLTGIDAPHEVTVKRDADFGTMSANAAYAAFAEGRDAALAADAAGIRAAQADINAAILTTFLQATLKYSYKVQAGGNDKDWAEGYTYWRVMAGAVAAADLETAKAIDALWDMSAASIDTLASDVHCQIMHLLDDALPIMGISYSGLGELTQDHGKGIVIPEGICDDESSGAAESKARLLTSTVAAMMGSLLAGLLL